MKLLLTLMFSVEPTPVYFEFNCCLNKLWVILQHLLLPIKVMVILDVVAGIMDSRCADVTTGTFE